MFKARTIAIAIACVMTISALATTSMGSPAETRPGAATPASPCIGGSPVRHYNVTAFPLPISYNHWGDMDLEGRLFAPRENVDPILADVSAKLTVAGLGDLAQPVTEMRAALAAQDIAAATAAAARFVEAAAATDGSVPPHARVDQTDLVQPLILRAHVGDCVQINLTNIMPEPVSIHVHAVIAQPGAGEAVGVQQADFANPGQSRNYTMKIPDWESMEGAHFLHSHVDSRQQTRHGLFGAVVAEPKGSLWRSTSDVNVAAPTGLEAIIIQPNAPDFREFVKIYHDEIELVDWRLQSLPEIDQYGIYGPGTKGINLRSEPFMDRFQFHDELRDEGVLKRGHDKSQSYGSYTYGDPATWIQKSYVGDPVKFRMINAGPGQYHIHHLHGGGIRWKSTPMVEPTQFALGLTKGDDPRQVQASASQRLDVQNAGPGESFNLEPEGGTGGVQQSAGDFLYHCHIAEHYLAGMWGIWRAYNTLQPGLAELPDQSGRHAWAVNSAALVGHVFNDGSTLTADNIDEWVESFLPARGVPGEEDASVWNWSVRIDETTGLPVYLGEPETHHVWPNYPADAPGRLPAGTPPEIGFDPITAKPAYPMLRPQLGARPPFSPEHSGAPFLKHSVTDANPDGLCTKDARSVKYDMVAIQTPVKYNKFDTDQRGQVFVRTVDKHDVVTGKTPATSAVLRGNAGDCIDVTLTSELNEKSLGDRFEGIHTKTNIHIHLVQFDVQGSDGVVAGFNYETTVRSLNGSSSAQLSRDPSAPVNTKVGTLGARTIGASTVIEVDDVRPFFDRIGQVKVGSTVGVGLGIASIESGKLVSVVKNPTGNGGNVTLDRVLANPHSKGENIGYEFVRYQWYPDVELGTVYFHDHVNGLDTWRHGLFGSLIIEPTGSRWLSPKRVNDAVPDDPVSHVVDIVPASGQGPAYREIVLHFQDRACVNPSAADCLSPTAPQMPHLVDEPAAFNLRSEPVHRRNPEHPFWSRVTYGADVPATPVDERSQLQGDPATMALEAYPGDDVVIRYLYTGAAASRAVGTFGVTGHRFQQEQFMDGSRTTDAISVAISSQHNLQLECGAGGCTKQPGDYLYYMTQPEYLERGAWGLIRVHDPSDLSKIRPLPNNPAPTAGAAPSTAQVRYFDVSAIEGLVVHNPNAGLASQMKRFVLDSELPIMANGQEATLAPPEPLVMRAHAGEIVQVNLTNRLATGTVGLHAGMVSAGPADQGVQVGANSPVTTAAPGQTVRYQWYADRELGVVDLVSLVGVDHAEQGLVGALVIEPAGVDVSSYTGSSALLDLGNDIVAREQVLLFASPDGQFQSSTMPYLPDVAGLAMINYASEPLARRLGAIAPAAQGAPAFSGTSLSSCHVDPDTCMHPRNWEVRNPGTGFATSGLAPWTPIVEAVQGQPIVLRVTGASGDQLATVHVDGHSFAIDPDMPNCRTLLSECKSNVVSTTTVGAREVRNIWIPFAGEPGDYLYRNHREAYFEAGAWGLLRVTGPTLLPEGTEPQIPGLTTPFPGT